MKNKEKAGLEYMNAKSIDEVKRVLATGEKHIEFDLSHSAAFVAGFDYARSNPTLNGDGEAT